MSQPIPSKQSIVAAVIGNSLEWFDLVVYGFFAPVIAELFFPARDPNVSLLLALGTFGVSFIVRPIGAIVLGRIADRSGRRGALVLVTSLMFLGTLIIAVLPTYGQIGFAAPALLLSARLIQGFSAGGEFGSATAYLAEHSPGRRGFYSSWQFASQGIATLLASGVGLCASLMDHRALYSWGWRLPFVLGLAIGPVAYFIRRNAGETPEFEAAQKLALRADRKPATLPPAAKLAVGSGAVLVATVSLYFLLYTPTFVRTVLHLDASIGFWATLVAGVALLVLPPIAGNLSDRVGRFAVAMPPATLLSVVPIPLFLWLVHGPSGVKVILVQGTVGVIIATYLGALPALLSELFALEVRSTGLSLSYNIAVVIAGGFAPMLFVLLVGWTGSQAAPSFYLSFAAATSAGVLLAARRWGWVR